jgi:SAM-dependent methyltransferase
MHVDWGSLRRTTPISREFGFDRGTPVDRYYIAKFLNRSRNLVAGRVLEIGDDSYTREYGSDAVTMRDVLHVHEGNPKATIIGDLSSGDGIPSDAFDCAIITQTLHLIFDPVAALRTLHRILKPGGVLLATAPGVSPISIDEWSSTWYWSFTYSSLQRMAETVFGQDVRIDAYGNVFASTCFLHGIAAEEVTTAELDVEDDEHVTLLSVTARKTIP